MEEICTAKEICHWAWYRDGGICTAKEICHWAWYKHGGNLHSKGNLSLGMVQRWGKSAQQRKSVIGHGTKMEEICTAKEIYHWAWYRDGGNLFLLKEGSMFSGGENRKIFCWVLDTFGISKMTMCSRRQHLSVKKEKKEKKNNCYGYCDCSMQCIRQTFIDRKLHVMAIYIFMISSLYNYEEPQDTLN